MGVANEKEGAVPTEDEKEEDNLKMIYKKSILIIIN